MRWIILCLATASPAAAQDLGTAYRNFNVHCAGCHGPDADGEGVAELLLDRDPPDLTTLARRNGGVFPTAHVVFQIDGRAEASRAHWDEMPNFGDLLEGETVAIATDSGQPILTSPAIAELVAWLKSIQQ